MSSLILLGAWYDGIMRSINGFLTNVVGLVYKFAAYALRIFLILANGKLIDSDKYSTLINNFYIIIGIVMLFLLAFALLRGMINPDDKKQGTEMVKKVILNLVTSTLIIAVLPTIFAFAFDFQNSVLIKQNTIGRLFGYGGNGGVDLAVDQGANQLANGVFTAFFNVDQAMCDEGDTLEECQAKVLDDDNNPLLLVMQVVDSTGQFGLYANFQEEIGQKIEHNWLLNLIAGIFLSYVAISFCFDMAIRMIKLIFYQIIAPIPVFLRVVPDGKLSGTFNQWVKVTLTCYLEVYIRILVFYFCIYLFNSLFGSDGYGADVFGFLSGTAYGVGLFVKAFVIMGIVMFMKQAPKLISEITGIDSGNMKLGIKDKLKDGGFFAAGAALGAGATTMTRNATNAWRNFNKADGFKGKAKAAAAGVGSIFAGGVSGTFRGGRAGMSAKSFGDMKSAAGKGAEEAVKARGKRANYKAAHGGFIGSVGGHIKDVGISLRNYAFDQSIEGLTRESQSMGKLASSFNTYSEGIEALLEKEQSKGDASVFFYGMGADGKMHDNGFRLSSYNAFDQAAKAVAKARAEFNAGILSADDLRNAESAYVKARDDVRDELMNIGFKGQKGAEYQALNAKGQAALKDALVNAESLQAVILENASSSVVQNVIGNKGLEKIVNKDPSNPFEIKDLETTDPVTGQTIKLKDAAKVAQGQADMKIAEMNKENAAKGDNKK